MASGGRPRSGASQCASVPRDPLLVVACVRQRGHLGGQRRGDGSVVRTRARRTPLPPLPGVLPATRSATKPATLSGIARGHAVSPRCAAAADAGTSLMHFALVLRLHALAVRAGLKRLGRQAAAGDDRPPLIA